MYEVIGREAVWGRRFSRFIVRFSTPWPHGARRVYLVSILTSLYPGRFEMSRFKGRAYLTLSVWDGLYPYWFSADGLKSVLDEEVVERVEVKFFGSRLEASLARVGVEEYSRAVRGERDWWDLVVHDERSPNFLSRLGPYTIARLWLPRGVVSGATLEYRAHGDERGEVEMSLVGSDDLKDYYEAWIEGVVAGYRFKLRGDGKLWVFGRGGLGDNEPIVPPDNLRGPSEIPWWVGAVYYMVFVDSFDRVLEKSVEYIKRLEPREPGYYGGDLLGVARRASYIESLGVNAIYLTPINLAASYHRYDVIDHFSVDPLLGGWSAFEKLLEELKSRGLKLILDLVVHHTSLCHRGFVELLEGRNRLYRLIARSLGDVDRGVIEEIKRVVESGCKAKPSIPASVKPFYESFAGTWHMPKVDHDKLYARKLVKRVISYWLSRGVDGFRFDVGHAIPDSAMREYYEYIKSLRRDAIVISEITAGLEYYPLGVTIDAATNYDLREYMLRFFIERDVDAWSLAGFIARQYSRIPPYSALSNMNLLGSHDTPRVRTLASQCYPECVERMYSLLFILPGSPAIYYGDEVGMEGLGDPDCRRPMVWNEEVWDNRLLSYIRKLAKIRKSVEALKLGGLRVRALSGDVVEVRRPHRGVEAVGYVSRSGEFRVSLEGVQRVFIGRVNGDSITSENGVVLTLRQL